MQFTWHVLCKVQAGLQAVFKMSKQISPVCTACAPSSIARHSPVCWRPTFHGLRMHLTEGPQVATASHAYLEVDVRMENLCAVIDNGRDERVLVRNPDIQLKDPSFIGSLCWTLQRLEKADGTGDQTAEEDHSKKHRRASGPYY